MRILVTGASGLLGRGVATALAARGDDVTVFQRRPSGLPDCSAGSNGGPPIRECLGDIADAAAVDAAVARQEAVVHLAAKVHVVGAWADYLRSNVEGTRHVVDSARRHGVRSLVQVSSPSVAHAGSALVGAGAGPADPQRARGRYARSKALAERLALAGDGAELHVIAVRPHLVWGPGDTQLVERIVARARAGRLALVGSGLALIDTTYLDNAVTAIVAALDRAEDCHGRAYVVSNGEPRTVTEIFTRLCAAAGAPAPRIAVPRPLAWLAGAAVDTVWERTGRDDDPPMTRFLAEQLSTAHWFDQRSTRVDLRWVPEVSLDEGFTRLAQWYARQR